MGGVCGNYGGEKIYIYTHDFDQTPKKDDIYQIQAWVGGKY
jgi:hypothetical protein